MFNWQAFLSARGIAFVTRGPNTGRGSISVQCPWCGEADPSQHLGISLTGAGWGCLRNATHRGKSRARLIAALLRCSSEEAHRLAGTNLPSPTPRDEDFAAEVAFLLGERPIEEARPRGPLRFPPEIKPLYHRPGAILAEPFWEYLESPLPEGRGYRPQEAGWLAEHYDLHYAVQGPDRYRVIIPVYDSERRLQTWTGRTILKDEKQRYKTLPRIKSLEVTSNLLLGLPLLMNLSNANLLVIDEGPFDALRISAFGHKQGVYGTCLFGLNVSDAQSILLDQLSRRFKRMLLLLDPDADWALLRIRESLLPLRVEVGRLPNKVKDPGDLTMDQAHSLIDTWLEG